MQVRKYCAVHCAVCIYYAGYISDPVIIIFIIIIIFLKE